MFVEGVSDDVQVVGELLELTVAASDAGRTLTVMLGEDQLNVELSALSDLR